MCVTTIPPRAKRTRLLMRAARPAVCVFFLGAPFLSQF
jgi:hypothetical protein